MDLSYIRTLNIRGLGTSFRSTHQRHLADVGPSFNLYATFAQGDKINMPHNLSAQIDYRLAWFVQGAVFMRKS